VVLGEPMEKSKMSILDPHVRGGEKGNKMKVKYDVPKGAWPLLKEAFLRAQERADEEEEMYGASPTVEMRSRLLEYRTISGKGYYSFRLNDHSVICSFVGYRRSFLSPNLLSVQMAENGLRIGGELGSLYPITGEVQVKSSLPWTPFQGVPGFLEWRDGEKIENDAPPIPERGQKREIREYLKVLLHSVHSVEHINDWDDWIAPDELYGLHLKGIISPLVAAQTLRELLSSAPKRVARENISWFLDYGTAAKGVADRERIKYYALSVVDKFGGSNALSPDNTGMSSEELAEFLAWIGGE